MEETPTRDERKQVFWVLSRAGASAEQIKAVGSVWTNGGGGPGQFLLGILPYGGLMVFDAQHVVGALRLREDLRGFFLAVQRVGGEDAAHEVHQLGAQEFLGGGQFVPFVGRSDKGEGRAAFVFDQADDAAQVVANGFAANPQRF